MSNVIFENIRRLLQKSKCQKCGKTLSDAERKQGKLCSACKQGEKKKNSF